ncbi:hypothetical protein FIBSPDRAFT_898391 [Athelia psychrophila]|uniref:Uncharacterized protein n=1 Tax=Athelia psychrophila TaxID=1759441 RepID=A0A166B161_9AGAM|nr:hypothetical protein FIBSPDRAFT_898391 [Fibularhizoctonia sp. CBS 109695]
MRQAHILQIRPAEATLTLNKTRAAQSSSESCAAESNIWTLRSARFTRLPHVLKEACNIACSELVWIILAVMCRVRVIEIGDGEMLRIKTVWTVFAVLYQFIATAPLADVLAYVFFCEWNCGGIQRRSKGGIAVSTLAVGLVDRGIYASFKRSSLPFILAFLASLFATILSAVAPAVISINPIHLNQTAYFSVGTFFNTSAGAEFTSNALVFLEQIQNFSYGYDMPAGTLFSMPSREYLSQNPSWTFDVVHYNYTCSYRAPTYQLSLQAQDSSAWESVEWVVDDAKYIFDTTSVPGVRPALTDRTGFFETGLVQLAIGVWPLINWFGAENNGTIAWFFIGTTYGHAGFDELPWRIEFLSLENIPTQNTTYNSTGFSDLWPLAAVPQSAIDESASEEEESGTFGYGPILSAILNPLLQGDGSSQKFSARRSWKRDFPLSPVNWAAGALTLQALGNASKISSVNGVAYYDFPLAPEVSVTALQTSLEQLAATIGLVVLIVILAIALLIVGIGSLPLTVSTVERVLQRNNGNNGDSERIAMNTSYESIPLKYLSE